MSKLDNLTSSVSVTVNWTAERDRSGPTPIQNTTTLTQKENFKTIDNTGSNVWSFTQSVAASGTHVFDFGSEENVLNESIVLTGVKALMIRLISVAQDSVNGTDASGIKFGAELYSLNTNGVNIEVLNGHMFLITTNALGTSSHGDITVTNLDATHAASVEITILGDGL